MPDGMTKYFKFCDVSSVWFSSVVKRMKELEFRRVFFLRNTHKYQPINQHRVLVVR